MNQIPQAQPFPDDVATIAAGAANEAADTLADIVIVLLNFNHDTASQLCAQASAVADAIARYILSHQA